MMQLREKMQLRENILTGRKALALGLLLAALIASLLAARPAAAATGAVAWGSNNFGELGNGTNTDSNVPVSVSNLGDIKSVEGGCFHSLALKTDGTVRSWGNGAGGQLGNGTSGSGTYSNVPVTVSNLSGVKAIAAGSNHGLALLDDGKVRAWGYNAYGQLGDGTNTSKNTPVTVSNLTGVQAIGGGSGLSLAVKQ